MPPLNRKQRLYYAAIGCGLLALLLVARLLTPNKGGMGTHQKLGLPPCTAIMWFGIPCPSCGMTTSWSHFTRGEFVRSWQCNAGGLCLALASIGTGFWTITMAIRGRYWRLITLEASTILAIIIFAITIVDWVLRIF